MIKKFKTYKIFENIQSEETILVSKLLKYYSSHISIVVAYKKVLEILRKKVKNKIVTFKGQNYNKLHQEIIKAYVKDISFSTNIYLEFVVRENDKIEYYKLDISYPIIIHNLETKTKKFNL